VLKNNDKPLFLQITAGLRPQEFPAEKRGGRQFYRKHPFFRIPAFLSRGSDMRSPGQLKSAKKSSSSILSVNMQT